MANWKFKTVVTNKENGFNVIKADFKLGDMFATTTIDQTTTGGVTFLTSGSINAYDANMDLRVEQSREEGKILVPPLGETEPLTVEGERTINMVATAAGQYYCISGEVEGEVTQLSPNESQTLTGVMGKRLFLAEDGITVDGIAYEKHSVIHCETVDTVTVQAGATPAIFATFSTVSP